MPLAFSEVKCAFRTGRQLHPSDGQPESHELGIARTAHAPPLTCVLSFTIQANHHSPVEAFITFIQTLFRVLISSVLFVSLAVAQNANAPGNTPQTAPKKSPSKALTLSANGVATGARAIHNSALVIDTHADTPGRFVDENFDLAQDAGTGDRKSTRLNSSH